MTGVLHVIDIGDAPMIELSDLVNRLQQERRVIGVWYRRESEWPDVINKTKGEVFADLIQEKIGTHTISRMILLIPEWAYVC